MFKNNRVNNAHLKRAKITPYSKDPYLVSISHRLNSRNNAMLIAAFIEQRHIMRFELSIPAFNGSGKKDPNYKRSATLDPETLDPRQKIRLQKIRLQKIRDKKSATKNPRQKIRGKKIRGKKIRDKRSAEKRSATKDPRKKDPRKKNPPKYKIFYTAKNETLFKQTLDYFKIGC
jgi:hypothetical protein